MSEYRPRIVDQELRDALGVFGAVLIVGPRWCGKTTTASQVAESVLRMQDPDAKARNLAVAAIKPSRLLIGDNPRLIDEWRTASQIWDAVRNSVDERDENGLYILTGSVTVDEDSIDHSGTGRIHRLRMGTMSLFESGDSTGTVSLRSLFDGEASVDGSSDLEPEDIARLVVRGGWPESVGMTERQAAFLVKGYCNSITNVELAEVDGRKRDSRKATALMRSLSRAVSSAMNKSAILEDVKAREGVEMSRNTMDDYLVSLRRICVLDELPAWSPNLRSRTAVRTARTVHLCDPAITAHFLSASSDDLMDDPETFGPLFEDLVIRDLRVYMGGMGGEIFHYRDKNGLEVDAILRSGNGRWGLVEARLGQGWIEDGARNLLKLRDMMDTGKMGEPAFMAVITGTKRAYTREDGVHVIPITCLRDRGEVTVDGSPCRRTGTAGMPRSRRAVETGVPRSDADDGPCPDHVPSFGGHAPGPGRMRNPTCTIGRMPDNAIGSRVRFIDASAECRS